MKIASRLIGALATLVLASCDMVAPTPPQSSAPVVESSVSSQSSSQPAVSSSSSSSASKASVSSQESKPSSSSRESKPSSSASSSTSSSASSSASSSRSSSSSASSQAQTSSSESKTSSSTQPSSSSSSATSASQSTASQSTTSQTQPSSSVSTQPSSSAPTSQPSSSVPSTSSDSSSSAPASSSESSSSSSSEATVTFSFDVPSAFGSDVYLYAWNDETNTGWPGIKLVNGKANLGLGYEKFLLSNGEVDETQVKTIDLKLDYNRTSMKIVDKGSCYAIEGVGPKYMPEYAGVNKKSVTLPEGFIYGMDASAVPALEKAGIKYYNEAGEEEDVYKILADHGVTHIRVRIWNDPYDSEGHGYGAGNCDVDNAIAIGKRATEYGMKLHVDFHYSDFWADPGKQNAPKAWKDLTLEQKKTALYSFTKDSLNAMKDEGVDVGMVQVGNETNQLKMAGETNRENVAALMNQGSKAVREVYPEALVATHFAPYKSGGQLKYPDAFASYLKQYSVDYDVLGCSYYPYWHGTLEDLSAGLTKIGQDYGKKVMVMETSYAHDDVDVDFCGNTSPKSTDYQPHEISIQGQYDQIYDVIDTVVNDTNGYGIGVCYWEGTWIAADEGNWADCRAKWEEYGIGWASSYAAEYDPDAKSEYDSNPEYWSGGCVIENQAFFDRYGNVLPSLDVFKAGKETTPEVTYKIAASFTNWATEAITMSKCASQKEGKDQYELEITAPVSNSEFKFVAVGNGDDLWYPADNIVLSEAAKYKVYYVPEGGITDENWTDGHYYIEKVEDVAPVTCTYYLVGGMNSWSTSDEYKFTKSAEQKNGKDQYQIDVTFANSDIPFKMEGIADDEGHTATWYPSGTGNDQTLPAGKYTIYFVPDGGISDEGWTIGYYCAVKTGDVEEAQLSYVLAGDFNSWSTTANPMSKAAEKVDGKTVWEVTVHFSKGNREFKFVSSAGVWIPGGSNLKIQIGTAGDYTVRYCPEGNIADWDNSNWTIVSAS